MNESLAQRFERHSSDEGRNDWQSWNGGLYARALLELGKVLRGERAVLLGNAGDVRARVKNPTLIRIRVWQDAVASAFLRLVWDSKGIRDQIEAAAHTTAGIWKISQTDLEGFLLPIPPLPEQREIVRRVEQLFTLADQLEAHYARARAHVNKLTQSLLAKAFRGELVPQDPNDEPAAALLACIRSNVNGAPP